jgi:hypothetical protein
VSGYDWTEHPSVVDCGGWYVIPDPQHRGTWKVLRSGDGWIASGANPADWQVLGIPAGTGGFTVFASEQDAIAAILGSAGGR